MNLTDYQLAALIGAGPFLILTICWLIGLAVVFRFPATDGRRHG